MKDFFTLIRYYSCAIQIWLTLDCPSPAHCNKESQADIQKKTFFLPSINMDTTRHEKYSKGHKREKQTTLNRIENRVDKRSDENSHKRKMSEAENEYLKNRNSETEWGLNRESETTDTSA